MPPPKAILGNGRRWDYHPFGGWPKRVDPLSLIRGERLKLREQQFA